jgi:ABC-type nitrate/sulfonate/bicarbonate transport system substrate-binding protein
MRTPLRRASLVAPLLVLLTALVACSSGASAGSGTGTPSSAAASGSGSAPAGERTAVRFALDWTPNTNHTGLYVAQQQGWFEQAGIDLQVLPYNTALPETLVDAGNAEFGVSFQDSTTVAQAAGADIVSVLAVLQHWATGIGVRADRTDLNSPKDLDGKTYAGFGGPTEEPLLKTVIRDDGGTGEFTTVTLGTSAYEALYSGNVDFTIPFLAWEGIEAEHNGTPMKYFKYTDYGFPDAYSVVIIGNRSWLAEHPDVAKAFVQTLQRGYQFAADDPDEAAKLLIAANPGAFPDESLVTESQQLLATDYMKTADGTVGPQTQAQWAAYGTFLYDNGLLIGPDGAPLTAEPDYSTLFTDEYLSS